MDKKYVMISQPLAGKPQQEIIETRDRAFHYLQESGYTVIDTLFSDEWHREGFRTACGVVNVPLCYLAKSLEYMSLCNTVYFCKGWDKARGCCIEHEAAKAYGLEILYEE